MSVTLNLDNQFGCRLYRVFPAVTPRDSYLALACVRSAVWGDGIPACLAGAVAPPLTLEAL